MWLSVSEVASLIGCSPRTIRRNINDYIHRRHFGCPGGKNGFSYEIALTSLSPAAQARYNGSSAEDEPIYSYEETTDKQRREAEYKALVIERYYESGMSRTDFVKWHNDTFTSEEPIHYQSFAYWLRNYNAGGINALVDRRGGYNRGASSVPEPAWECFKSLYLTEQRLSKAFCYDETKKAYPDIPAINSFYRAIDSRLPFSVQVYYRQGKKAFNDKCIPDIARDKDTICANDVWFSDHHDLDIFVRDGKGSVARPVLTMWLDAATNKIMSWAIRFAKGNTEIIKKTLYEGICEFGAPRMIYVDNGKDYRSKELSDDFPHSPLKALGIKTRYATKYHGQTKVIERIFGIVATRFSRQFATWCGNNTANKPESMKMPKKDIERKAPALDEIRSAFTEFVEWYNNTASRAQGLNRRSPNQAYSDKLTEKRTVEDKEALLMLFGKKEERVVNKNGVCINHNTYYHEKMLSLIGKRVLVTFLPDNIDAA